MNKKSQIFCKLSNDKPAPDLAWGGARCRAIASTVLGVMMALAVTDCDAREASPMMPATREFAAPSEPDQIAELLQNVLPDEYGQLPHQNRFDFITRHTQAARGFGIKTLYEKSFYCALALMYGEDFASQPSWSKGLADVRAGKLTLQKLAEQIEATQTLKIHGYNYTNRYIEQFYVDGNAGGSLFVSGAGGGGGRSACCFRHPPGAPAPKTVKVKWPYGGCIFSGTYSSGEVYSSLYPFYKTLDVLVDPKVPANPGYFEVHFYPDGHVEAAITEHSSPPRLILSADRKDRSDYPRCPNDQQPKE